MTNCHTPSGYLATFMTAGDDSDLKINIPFWLQPFIAAETLGKRPRLRPSAVNSSTAPLTLATLDMPETSAEIFSPYILYVTVASSAELLPAPVSPTAKV